MDYVHWPSEKLIAEALRLSEWIADNPGKFDGVVEKMATIKYIKTILVHREHHDHN